MRPPRKPRLRPEIVADEDQLWSRIDVVLRNDSEIRKASFHVLQAARAVRISVDQLGLAGLLWWEEEHNSRAATAYVVLVKWAFLEGVRHAERRRRPW